MDGFFIEPIIFYHILHPISDSISLVFLYVAALDRKDNNTEGYFDHYFFICLVWLEKFHHFVKQFLMLANELVHLVKRVYDNIVQDFEAENVEL